MTARTVTQFSAFLQDELGWRRKELFDYRTWVDQFQGTARQSPALRGAITVLYAHWEGFVKIASEEYLKFVSEQRLNYNELTSNFIALAAKAMIQQSTASDKMSVHMQLVDFFQDGLETRARFSWKKVINTRANLSVDVFRNIVDVLGIEYRPAYAAAEKPIIERLLELRNGIAHGESKNTDPPEYMQLHARIDEILVLFGNDLDNAASTGRYRKRRALGVAAKH